MKWFRFVIHAVRNWRKLRAFLMDERRKGFTFFELYTYNNKRGMVMMLTAKNYRNERGGQLKLML